MRSILLAVLLALPGYEALAGVFYFDGWGAESLDGSGDVEGFGVDHDVDAKAGERGFPVVAG